MNKSTTIFQDNLLFCKFIGVFAALTIFFSSCSNDNEMPPMEKHIVIAYLAGDDSSLSSEIVGKVKALSQGVEQLNEYTDHLLVYADRTGSRPVLMDIKSNHIDTLVIYDKQNSADPEIMNSIINKALSYYPSADSYGLIFFSHGTAWLPLGSFNNPSKYSKSAVRTALVDNDDELDIIDFASALPVPYSRPWNFILFENCFMGSVEVAYQIKDKADFIVASESEVISPGYTSVYKNNLYLLFQDEPLLTTFAQSFFNYWNSYSADDERKSATVSVIKTQYLDELVQVVGNSLKGHETDFVYNSAIQHFDRNGLICDLDDALTAVVPSSEVPLRDVLEKIVVYKSSTPWFLKNAGIGYFSYPINAHCGLSIYTPHAEYSGVNEYYENLDWSTAIKRELE